MKYMIKKYAVAKETVPDIYRLYLRRIMDV